MLQNRLPNLKVIVYVNGLDGPSNCTFRLDSSAPSLAGFARLGQDLYLNPRR
jgi:hypothetical protein